MEDRLPDGDNSQQVDISELISLEELSTDQKLDQPMETLLFASDLSFSECISQQCLLRNMETTEFYESSHHISFTNPSDCLLSYKNSQDAFCQTEFSFSKMPSAQLQSNLSSTDSAAQCEILQSEDMEDLSRNDSRLQVSSSSSGRKSITIMEVEAWMKNNTDMAVSCFLPPIRHSSGEKLLMLPRLSLLIDENISKVVEKVDFSSQLQSSEIPRLQERINLSLTNKFTSLKRANNSVVTESDLVTWLLSVEFMRMFSYYLSKSLTLASQHWPTLPVKYERILLAQGEPSTKSPLVIPFSVKFLGHYYTPLPTLFSQQELELSRGSSKCVL